MKISLITIKSPQVVAPHSNIDNEPLYSSCCQYHEISVFIVMYTTIATYINWPAIHAISSWRRDIARAQTLYKVCTNIYDIVYWCTVMKLFISIVLVAILFAHVADCVIFSWLWSVDSLEQQSLSNHTSSSNNNSSKTQVIIQCTIAHDLIYL